MKKLVVLSALIALTAIGTDVYGYTYTITNYTDKTLLVDVRPVALVGDSKPAFIKPGKTMKIDYKDLFCIGKNSVYVAPVEEQSVLGFTTTIDQAIDTLYTPPTFFSPSDFPAQKTAMTEASVVVQTKKIQMSSSLKKITNLTPENLHDFNFNPITSEMNVAQKIMGGLNDFFQTVSGIVDFSWVGIVEDMCTDQTIGIFLTSDDSSYVWTLTSAGSWLSKVVNSIDSSTDSAADYLAKHAGTSIFGN